MVDRSAIRGNGPVNATFGETLTNVLFAPVVPWPFATLLGLAAAVMVCYGLYHRANGSTWRALAFFVIVLSLFNPTLVSERRDALSDTGVIVVETWRSRGGT